MKYCYTFLLLFFALNASSAEQVKVLFIGNSFVYYNSMPDIFKAMATKAGYDTKVSMHAPGGIYVAYTPQGNLAHANNPAVYTLIKSEKWDYVIIQDNQGFFVQQVGVFVPDGHVIDGHAQLRDSILANNPCAKVILFSGWCFKNGNPTPPVFANGSEMNTRVYQNYRVLNDSIKQIISPIGIAWNRIIKDMPAKDLWDADEAHPSYAGSYLTAATIFSTNLTVRTLPAGLGYMTISLVG